MGFDDCGSWVLTTVEIDVGFDEIGVGVTTVEIGVVEISGWRDWCGGDQWQGRAWWRWGWIPKGSAFFLGSTLFFFFWVLLGSVWVMARSSSFGLCIFFFFNIGFVPVEFWWAVGSGGVVGMVEARWW